MNDELEYILIVAISIATYLQFIGV